MAKLSDFESSSLIDLDDSICQNVSRESTFIGLDLSQTKFLGLNSQADFKAWVQAQHETKVSAATGLKTPQMTLSEQKFQR